MHSSWPSWHDIMPARAIQRWLGNGGDRTLNRLDKWKISRKIAIRLSCNRLPPELVVQGNFWLRLIVGGRLVTIASPPGHADAGRQPVSKPNPSRFDADWGGNRHAQSHISFTSKPQTQAVEVMPASNRVDGAQDAALRRDLDGRSRRQQLGHSRRIGARTASQGRATTSRSTSPRTLFTPIMSRTRSTASPQQNR